jgi:hypothetical protein
MMCEFLEPNPNSEVRLDKAISQLRTIRGRCEAIKGLLGGSLCPTNELALKSDSGTLCQWVAEKINQVLENAVDIYVADASYLVEILVTQRSFNENMKK